MAERAHEQPQAVACIPLEPERAARAARAARRLAPAIAATSELVAALPGLAPVVAFAHAGAADAAPAAGAEREPRA